MCRTPPAEAGAAVRSFANNNALNGLRPAPPELNAGGLWLFLTSTGNGLCDAVQDSPTSPSPAPTANGADLTVCANDPEVQLNGSVTVATGGTWSGGNGIFTPEQCTPNATCMPSLGELAAGTVQLALTTTGQWQLRGRERHLVVDIDPVPVVNAGPDQQVCANNPAIQLNGVGNAPGAIWSGGNGTTSRTPPRWWCSTSPPPPRSRPGRSPSPSPPWLRRARPSATRSPWSSPTLRWPTPVPTSRSA